MLTNTAVFFICWKKSLLQSPLVAGVKEQATMMKSDSAASLGVDTGGEQGSSDAGSRGGDGRRVGDQNWSSLPSPELGTPKKLPEGLVST